MKLTIHNKLVILKKKIVPLFITKFIWIIIVHFFLYIMLWLHLLYIIYLYDQNWQLVRSTNMSLGPFPLYQSSWNRLIAQSLPKAQKQTPAKQKRTTIHTLQDNIEKKKKKLLIINHLIPHLPHLPTYPATPLLSLLIIIARNFWVSSLLLFKFISPFSLNLDLILLFSFRHV